MSPPRLICYSRVRREGRGWRVYRLRREVRLACVLGSQPADLGAVRCRGCATRFHDGTTPRRHDARWRLRRQHRGHEAHGV